MFVWILVYFGDLLVPLFACFGSLCLVVVYLI